MTHLLVFARCAGFVFRAPGLSHPSVPPPVRAGFALALSLGIAPRSMPIDGGTAGVVIALLTEFLVGSVLGTMASLLYDGAYAGGRVVDDYVGVKAIAPNVQLVAPSGFGRIWSLVFTGSFFLSGAYRPMLAAFAASFTRIAPGTPVHAGAWTAYAAAYATGIVSVGAQVAAPAVAFAFVVQIAVGALSRVVPRFGSLTLAFPLAFAAALLVTVIAAPLTVQHARPPSLPIPP